MKFRQALLVILFCIFAENSHLIFQAAWGRGNYIDTYYFLVDFSMYSVKAVLASCVVAAINNPVMHRRGVSTLFYTLTTYYTIDCINMFLWGNYDGLAPMLAGMGLATILAAAIHFRDKYQIIRRDTKNKLGF